MEKVCSTLKALERRIGLRRDATRAPIQGPEWQGAASPPPQTQTQTPPDLSLLTAKIGLDNGVHFTPSLTMSNGSERIRTSYLSDYSFALNKTKTIKSFALPNNSNVVALAITPGLVLSTC